MNSSDLRNWPIFSLLEPEFVSRIHMVVVYGNLGNEALIVTKDKMVYGLGNNIAGCLGTSDAHSTLHPKKIEVLCDKDIKTFAYGSGPHVLALTEKGEVYSWGHNGYCELGNGTCNQGLTPILVNMPTLGAGLNMKRIVDIACGSHHSLVLTEDGEVYAWGQNNCGQVGSSISTNQGAPRQVNSNLAGKKVVYISCGQTSSMVVTDNGEVYGWGYNGVGQLGIGNYVNQMTPSRVGSLIGIVIVKVVCGYAHTLALTDEGKLYVWGGNSYGQLGIGNKTNACNPVMVTHDMGRVSDIAALHYNHISVAVGLGGRVYMWGHCRGQSITSPTATPFSNIHDALACYGSPSVMHKPLILHANEDSSILECLATAFDDSSTSDLTIQVNGQDIHVHKAILKIRSPYFRTMFQHNWAENNQSIIEHDQFSYVVYKAFLKYLYTDMIDLPAEKALELLDLANAYCENNLKRHCIQMIKQGITILNAAYLYSVAIEYNAKELEEFCFKFALNHMTAVTQTENFAKLDENTIKEDDNMPQQICRLCFEKLNYICAFYDNCHEIQKKLWSTIEKANDNNNVEDKENTISPRSDLKYQIRTLENLRKKTHLTIAGSLIIDESPKNQNRGNRLRRSCLREICPNARPAISLGTQEQPVGIEENKRDSLAQKETADFKKTMKENIKKKFSLSENSKTLSLSPNNSKVWIQDISSDWFIPLRKADTPKNVANIVVNNSPPPGDEAESNGSSNFESNKLAVPDNIEGSPSIVSILPIEPKEACPLESNTISFQNKENANLSGSSIINECKVRRKCSKISELITNEQKQIIETHYLVDTDIINKYAEEVRNNMTVRDKNNIECNLCPAKYSRLDKCEVHIWAHLNIKPYKCKQCSFSTVTLSNVRCHIRKSHLKIKPFACKLCLKQYATFALLKEHVNIHTGVRPYKCETCGFSSTSRQALSNHMGTHMLSEDIPCSICDKTFHSRIRMRAHMRIHNDNNVTCDICRVRLSNEKALAAHREKVHVHDYVCKICNKVHKSRKALHNHMNAHKEATYKCTKCHKAYKSKHILNEHLLKHEGIRKYKCSVCEKSFAQQSHLAAHNKVHNPPSYECPGCGRKHNRRDNMKTHMTRCKSCK